MTFEEFQKFMHQHFPDGKIIELSEDSGEVIVSTGFYVQRRGPDIVVTPTKLPDNVIDFAAYKSKKFSNAQQPES